MSSIFMRAPKSGGAWQSFIDLTAAKKGGGRDVATRILQGLGKSGGARASAAHFDGKAYYYAEITQGKGRSAPSASALKSISFGGGDARTLFETPGEISEVTRVGEQVAFHLVLPPTAEQVKANEEERKKNKYAFGVSGENWLMAVPVAGGAGKRLMRDHPAVHGRPRVAVPVLAQHDVQVFHRGARELKSLYAAALALVPRTPSDADKAALLARHGRRSAFADE